MSPASRVVPPLLLAACCLLAGCGHFAGPTPERTSPTEAPATATPTPSATPARTAAVTSGPTHSATPGPTTSPDSAPDRLGLESGYAATDSLSVNATDGLNESEREAVVARTMARVELVRGLEFVESVPVEVVTRDEFRERNVQFVPHRDPRVTEQFWEALFLVGEDENATEAVRDVFAGGVVGYYQGGRVVLVSDDASPRVDTVTLAHELVHALQDQHFDRPRGRDTFDARVGARGLTEGDPASVERAYRERCTGEWSCLPGPRGGPSDGEAIARHPGIYLAFVQPYVTGPGFVADLRNRSGGDWTAVNDAYADPPRASEQVIRPDRYPDERPVEVTVPDRSGANWTRAGRDTAGEAGVHVALWANGFVERRDDSVATDYRHRLSAGWDGDTLVAYTRDGSAGDPDGNGSGGYVWRIVWENASEADEFERAYETLLRLRQGAREVAPGTYVTEDEPFVDAFRVTRTGRTATVVNAPTVEALEEVHAA